MARWSVPHVEDSTNGRPDFLRNRIRSEVVPVLRRENPQFVQNCSRMALTLRQDQALLDGMTLDALASLRDEGGWTARGFRPCRPDCAAGFWRSFCRNAACRSRSRSTCAGPRPWPAPAARPPGPPFPGGSAWGGGEKLAPMKPEPALRETALAVPGVTRTADWGDPLQAAAGGRKNSKYTVHICGCL